MRMIMKVFVLKGGKGENFSYILKVEFFVNILDVLFYIIGDNWEMIYLLIL